MGFYYHNSGTSIHEGLQAWPLHEDPTSSDVLVSDSRDCDCWHCAARRAGMDVLQHQGHLLTRSAGRFHLSNCQPVRYRINYRKSWIMSIYCFPVQSCRDSGVSLDHSVFSRTVSSTTLSPSSSCSASLHQLSSG